MATEPMKGATVIPSNGGGREGRPGEQDRFAQPNDDEETGLISHRVWQTWVTAKTKTASKNSSAKSTCAGSPSRR